MRRRWEQAEHRAEGIGYPEPLHAITTHTISGRVVKAPFAAPMTSPGAASSVALSSSEDLIMISQPTTPSAPDPGPVVTASPLPRASSSRALTTDECVERLFGASVGRVAFVTPTGLQVISVSVRATGTSLILDTSPSNSLSQVPEMEREVTLEVDDTLTSSGQAWSVLMHGPIVALDKQGRQRREAMSQQVGPWLGESCSQALEFTPRSYTGRLVQHPLAREPAPPSDHGLNTSGAQS